MNSEPGCLGFDPANYLSYLTPKGLGFIICKMDKIRIPLS